MICLCSARHLPVSKQRTEAIACGFTYILITFSLLSTYVFLYLSVQGIVEVSEDDGLEELSELLVCRPGLCVSIQFP